MEENNLISKPMTNEETKAVDAVNVQSIPKTQSEVNVPTQPAPTQPTREEVIPVAEVKDPEGVFDYTGCQTHVVKESETLFDVAQQYNIALQQLRYFNHVNKATLFIKTGQTLYIPKEPVHVPTGK